MSSCTLFICQYFDPKFKFEAFWRKSSPSIEYCRKGGDEHILIENTGRLEVNIFMSLGDYPEYTLVALDRDDLVVKVLYYRAENDKEIAIDLNKIEVANVSHVLV